MNHERAESRHQLDDTWDFPSLDGVGKGDDALAHGTIDNVAELDEISTLSTETENGKPHVNLTSLGYTKLLGTGKITKPLTVTVPSCSKTAKQKIKQAGGQVLTPSQENGE